MPKSRRIPSWDTEMCSFVLQILLFLLNRAPASGGCAQARTRSVRAPTAHRGGIWPAEIPARGCETGLWVKERAPGRRTAGWLGWPRTLCLCVKALKESVLRHWMAKTNKGTGTLWLPGRGVSEAAGTLRALLIPPPEKATARLLWPRGPDLIRAIWAVDSLREAPARPPRFPPGGGKQRDRHFIAGTLWLPSHRTGPDGAKVPGTIGAAGSGREGLGGAFGGTGIRAGIDAVGRWPLTDGRPLRGRVKEPHIHRPIPTHQRRQWRGTPPIPSRKHQRRGLGGRRAAASRLP